MLPIVDAGLEIPGRQPIGTLLAISGGLVAQIPQPTIGAAGLITSVAGLILALFQYWKAYLDAKIRAEKIAEQALEIAASRANVKALREALRKSLDLRVALQVKVARMEGEIVASRAELGLAPAAPGHIPEPLPELPHP